MSDTYDPNTFKLGEEEVAKIEAWTTEHVKTCPTPKAVTWGRWSYIFTPTGIVDMTGIKCLVCGKEEDVTHYSSLEDIKAIRRK